LRGERGAKKCKIGVFGVEKERGRGGKGRMGEVERESE